MGEWCTPRPARVSLRDVLESPAFDVPQRALSALSLALEESGLMVRTQYYVPDAHELYDMYHQLAHVDYLGRGAVPKSWLRWVMCLETQQALARKYVNQQVPRPVGIQEWIDGDHDHPVEVMNSITMVWQAQARRSLPAAIEAARLFDMPIRTDPAARRPMWEFIPEEER